MQETNTKQSQACSPELITVVSFNNSLNQLGSYIYGGIMKSLLVFISIIYSSMTMSADWKKIEGIYAVTSMDYLDPATDEHDSHYRFQLIGESAKDMYNAIKSQPIKDECTGGLAKNVDEMQCLYFSNTKKYECHFSIELKTQKITYGVAC